MLVNAVISNVDIDYLTAENGLRYRVDFEKVTSGRTDDENGFWLTTDFYRLADAVKATGNVKTYNLTPENNDSFETVDKDLGALGGTSLTINGTDEKLGLNGNNHTGITVAEGQSLSFNNVNDVQWRCCYQLRAIEHY